MAAEMSHFDEKGNAVMVDVSGKEPTSRTAVAEGINVWERGKRYVYRIAFGENQRIYFEPSLTDWVQQPTLIYTIK